MREDVAQLCTWADAVCAAYAIGGVHAAEDLLRQLAADHKFDLLGMEHACNWPGASPAQRREYAWCCASIRLDQRHYVRKAAKIANFSKLYGGYQPNMQQIPAPKKK